MNIVIMFVIVLLIQMDQCLEQGVYILDIVYVIGGEEEKSVLSFNIRTGNKIPAPPLLTPRCDASAVASSGEILLIGGSGPYGKPLNSTLLYRPNIKK